MLLGIEGILTDRGVQSSAGFALFDKPVFEITDFFGVGKRKRVQDDDDRPVIELISQDGHGVGRHLLVWTVSLQRSSVFLSRRGLRRICCCHVG